MNLLRHHVAILIGVFVFLLFNQEHAYAQTLAWDATTKHTEGFRGQTNVSVVFYLTNVSPAEVIVTAVKPSCHCTVAKVPALPWKLAPGDHGQMEVNVDVDNKWGSLKKSISVETSSGTNIVFVDIKLPEPNEREKNRLSAFADRQAVFKNDCATCHLQPALGKSGEELYKTICAICHESAHRAEMVPDLTSLKTPTNAAFWDQWIRRGKPGTFMPAFSKPFGGPLNEDSIRSLIVYLTNRFPPAASIPAPLQIPAKIERQ